MMSGVWQVLVYITIFCVFIEKAHGMMCLRCDSKNVNNNCRNGGKYHLSTKKYQTCYGRKPRCYAKATVDDDGNAHFKRGCTLKDICAESNDLYIEFCSTCTSKFCNYEKMILDPEVEEYLKEARKSKKSNVSKKTTATPAIDPRPIPVTEIVPNATSVTLAQTVSQSVSENVTESVLNTVYNTISVNETKNVPLQ